MPATFKIHPSIGVARLGDSPTEFYLSPDAEHTLPVQCNPDGSAKLDAAGHEIPVEKFKDPQNRIKRQAARFRVFVYDEAAPTGRELRLGDPLTIVNRNNGQSIDAQVTDVTWTVHLANKKAAWYEFDTTNGEHGYDKKHKLRNAEITDKHLRSRLIIDAGPRSVNLISGPGAPAVTSAEFSRQKNPLIPQSFPPPLVPNSIDTLGEIKVCQQDHSSRLVVLGGFGNSGSAATGLGQPFVDHYANNDGWFDDTSDGPVTALINYTILKVDGRPPVNPGSTGVVAVDDPAWCIVGYPRYVPEISDVITMDDLLFDVAVRFFRAHPEIYGTAGQPPITRADLDHWRATATWNRNYRPYFWRDIFPILDRPQYFNFVTDPGQMLGGDPHNATPGTQGQLDPDQLSLPPGDPNVPGSDPFGGKRRFVYSILRKPGDENDYTLPSPWDPTKKFPGMPLLCGDNCLTNIAPSKFLRLTDTQLFFLKQWADGKFVNERLENITVTVPPGEALDHGALATMLGGAFCPGAEACWIMRNPAIYAKPYRINVSDDFLPHPDQPYRIPVTLSLKTDLNTGLEPGDLTKYGALPWQTDFNE
ncbi:MAG: hypothetical protein RLZZ15_3660, partial [Verrucomicrobiota bacterium]